MRKNRKHLKDKDLCSEGKCTIILLVSLIMKRRYRSSNIRRTNTGTSMPQPKQRVCLGRTLKVSLRPEGNSETSRAEAGHRFKAWEVKYSAVFWSWWTWDKILRELWKCNVADGGEDFTKFVYCAFFCRSRAECQGELWSADNGKRGISENQLV